MFSLTTLTPVDLSQHNFDSALLIDSMALIVMVMSLCLAQKSAVMYHPWSQLHAIIVMSAESTQVVKRSKCNGHLQHFTF